MFTNKKKTYVQTVGVMSPILNKLIIIVVISAKDWGRCADGTSRLGCGPQEEFYNCADIAIEHTTNSHGTFEIPDLSKATNFQYSETSNNFPVNFEVGYGDNIVENTNNGNAISFLPSNVIKADNVGQVKPKFEFHDSAIAQNSLKVTTTQTMKPTEPPNVEKMIVPGIVELKFNGESTREINDVQNRSTARNGGQSGNTNDSVTAQNDFSTSVGVSNTTLTDNAFNTVAEVNTNVKIIAKDIAGPVTQGLNKPTIITDQTNKSTTIVVAHNNVTPKALAANNNTRQRIITDIKNGNTPTLALVKNNYAPTSTFAENNNASPTLFTNNNNTVTATLTENSKTPTLVSASDGKVLDTTTVKELLFTAPKSSVSKTDTVLGHLSDPATNKSTIFTETTTVGSLSASEFSHSEKKATNSSEDTVTSFNQPLTTSTELNTPIATETVTTPDPKNTASNSSGVPEVSNKPNQLEEAVPDINFAPGGIAVQTFGELTKP